MLGKTVLFVVTILLTDGTTMEREFSGGNTKECQRMIKTTRVAFLNHEDGTFEYEIHIPKDHHGRIFGANGNGTILDIQLNCEKR